MQVKVLHADGPMLARFEYLYQAEIFGAAISQVNHESIYEVRMDGRLISQWSKGKGTDSSGKPVKLAD